MRGFGRRSSRWVGGQRNFYGNTFINNRPSVVFLVFFLGIIVSLITGRVELLFGWTAIFLVLWFLGLLRI